MVSTTPVVEHSTGRVEDSTTNPVVKSPTIPPMECSTTAAVVQSTAGQVDGGPQKLAKAQVKRQKKQEKMTTGGPQSQEEVAGVQFRREKKKKKKSKKMDSPASKTKVACEEEVPGVVMGQLMEIAGADDEVAATHHTLTRRCSSAGDIRSMSPHQSPYQSSQLHRTSSYESLTTPVRPGAARKTATAETRCLFTGGLSVTEMRERAQVYTLHTYIHTRAYIGLVYVMYVRHTDTVTLTERQCDDRLTHSDTDRTTV